MVGSLRSGACCRGVVIEPCLSLPHGTWRSSGSIAMRCGYFGAFRFFTWPALAIYADTEGFTILEGYRPRAPLVQIIINAVPMAQTVEVASRPWCASFPAMEMRYCGTDTGGRYGASTADIAPVSCTRLDTSKSTVTNGSARFCTTLMDKCNASRNPSHLPHSHFLSPGRLLFG